MPPDRSAAVTDHHDATLAYHLFLGRSPESDGVAGQLIGAGLNDLAQRFLKSPEFVGRILGPAADHGEPKEWIGGVPLHLLDAPLAVALAIDETALVAARDWAEAFGVLFETQIARDALLALHGSAAEPLLRQSDEALVRLKHRVAKLVSDVEHGTFWDSPLIDDDHLKKIYGEDCHDRASAAAIYHSTPVDRRPDLTPYLDTRYYLARYDDVAKAGTDPHEHFYHNGFRENRSPHPLIDLSVLKGRYRQLALPGVGFDLFIRLMWADVPSSVYFDLEYYKAQMEFEVGVCHRGHLWHYLEHDLPRGLSPNAFFAPREYAQRHADVPFDGAGALRHFILVGEAAGRSPGSGFDSEAYRAAYPDACRDGEGALHHYLRVGRDLGYAAIAQHTAQSGPTVVVAPPARIDNRAAHDRVRADVNQRLSQLIDAVEEQDARPIRSLDPLTLLRDLEFAAVEPRVSILVPVFNEFSYVIEALASLAALPDVTPFEVVVADDASTDAAMLMLGDVPNLVYARQQENVGFLRNCNSSLAHCRADLVLFLNSDTQVLPGAIDALVEVIDREPDVGAVGPKMLYPNGRLQEAGCSIGLDGDAIMVGLSLDATAPAFNYDRDVQYCSGAALLVRRECLKDTVFDEQFMPAYCEDIDLCLRVTEQGFRIRYCAGATVVHHLSVSMTRESESKKLQRVRINQQKLVERWQEQLQHANRVRVIAFYLPQFHPTPANDLWWGKGFTEWTNVADARPSYDGHYQPHLPADLGFYDLRLPTTAAEQAKLARQYGVEGLCIYYYRFASGRVLDAALDSILADKSIEFPFCLCWANENWTKHWDGGNKEILLQQDYSDEALASICNDFVTYARDPRYILVDGAPLFLFYRPLLLPDATGFASMLRKACSDAGLPDPHLVYVESMETATSNIRPADLGFDASVEFPPHGRATPAKDEVRIVKEGWAGHRYDYEQTVINFIHRLDADYPRYPSVFPSWDNTPRQRLLGTSFDGASPGAFQAYVEAKIDEVDAFHTGDHRFLFVNAWNEWAEGAHLEPDARFGHEWLEALNRALRVKGAI